MSGHPGRESVWIRRGRGRDACVDRPSSRKSAAHQRAGCPRRRWRRSYTATPASAERETFAAAGFTLLEVLLALSIMSVLAVALFSSLHAAFKAKRSAEASIETIREGEATIEMLRAELEFALPPRGVLAGAFVGRDWAGAAGGSDDDVTFYSAASPPPTVFSTADIKRVMLTLLTLEGTGERVLARRVTSNLLATIRPEPDDEILCRGVSALDLKYFDGTLWWNSWDSTVEGDSLPVAVEVTLELDPPKSRTNAGDFRPLRFSRVVYLPCTGEGDPSDQEPATGEGEAGTGTGEGTGQSGGAGGGGAGGGGGGSMRNNFNLGGRR